MLVVTKLARLAPLLPDARDRGPWSPTFEADLMRLRTREGMKVARVKGRLRGKHPELSANQKRIWSRSTAPASTPHQRARRALRRHVLPGHPARRRTLRRSAACRGHQE